MKKTLWTSLGLLSFQAYAAIPQEVRDTFNEVKDDVQTVGYLLIGLAAVAMGLRWLKGMFF